MKKLCYTTVSDSYVYKIERHTDNRGYFEEIFSSSALDFDIKQINVSFSKMNTLRGLHVASFGKLVHCIKGGIFDVVADVRSDSKTYLKWYGIELNEENQKSLYIPPFCAHGFLSLCDDTIIVYAQDGLYDQSNERSVRYDNPILNIKWPVCEGLNISEKDLNPHFIYN